MRILKGTGDTPEGGLGHHPNRRLGASAKKNKTNKKTMATWQFYLGQI